MVRRTRRPAVPNDLRAGLERLKALEQAATTGPGVFEAEFLSVLAPAVRVTKDGGDCNRQ
jgi:hypothetical protein